MAEKYRRRFAGILQAQIIGGNRIARQRGEQLRRTEVHIGPFHTGLGVRPAHAHGVALVAILVGEREPVRQRPSTP
jgi:hypothetical protein